jgi:biopolymer transport protein ExbB
MFANFDWIGAMWSSPVMIIILACSVATLGFALERILYFWKRRGRPEDVLKAASDKVRGGRVDEALWVCMGTPHPVGAISAVVLKNQGQSADVQEEKMHIALSEQRMQLEHNLGFLGTMGNTAPLIGLLGTVWGIMRAFHDMASTGSAGPSVVAAGVAEALFTTAAGLLVAVPSVMLYNHFVRKISVMLTQAENVARALRLEVQDARTDSGTARRAA